MVCFGNRNAGQRAESQQIIKLGVLHKLSAEPNPRSLRRAALMWLGTLGTVAYMYVTYP